MPTVTDETVIEAPIDEVFEFMATPENHLDILPSLVDISNVEERSNGGYEGDFTFKIFGTHLDGRFEDVAFDPPNRRRYQNRGDLEGTVSYDLEPENGETRFVLEHEFETPGPELFGRLTEPMATRYMKREARSALENAKAMLEELRAEA